MKTWSDLHFLQIWNNCLSRNELSRIINAIYTTKTTVITNIITITMKIILPLLQVVLNNNAFVSPLLKCKTYFVWFSFLFCCYVTDRLETNLQVRQPYLEEKTKANSKITIQTSHFTNSVSVWPSNKVV